MATKKHKVLDLAGLKPKLFAGNDIMLDLETLDTSASAVILSIGACRFNRDEIDNEGFYRAITLQSNMDEHRTISPSTLLWWMDQSAKAKEVLNDPKAIPLGQALDEFREWVGPRWRDARVWANSPDFDCAILKHAYGQQEPPWSFWNTRCMRTLRDTLVGQNVPKPNNAGAHNALFDAVAQAEHVQLIWKAEKK